MPLFDEDSIVMIRNQRIAVGEVLWKLPTGSLEPEEAPAVTAYRELIEETGYEAAEIESLTTLLFYRGSIMFIYKLLFTLLITMLPFHEMRGTSGDIEKQYLLPEDHPAKASLNAIFSFDSGAHIMCNSPNEVYQWITHEN